jgi:tetratricopeptide (TPR) repeat protein
MKRRKDKIKKKQSKLSKALASSNKANVVQRWYFKNLTAGEIRKSVPQLAKHRHFRSSIHPNRDGASGFYVRRTPNIPLEKCISWCLGLLECHLESTQYFLDVQDVLLELLLHDRYLDALEVVDAVELKVGPTTWGISLKGTLLALIDVEARREYLDKTISTLDDNLFFKAIVFNLVGKFDDPETLQSESRFFEMKIKRTFSGPLLHFLMYKLVPFNVEFEYDFESILNFEKDASVIDVLQCLFDFLIACINTENSDTRAMCCGVTQDLMGMFKHDLINDLAVAYGIIKPRPIPKNAISVVDLYTAGNYQSVCTEMENQKSFQKQFGLVEIWAKALTRLDSKPQVPLVQFLQPLKAVLTKSCSYEKSRATLLAYCHALSMFPWFRELRYLLERETRFYNPAMNERLRQASLLLSPLTTPAKVQVLSQRGYLAGEEVFELTPTSSVTARLFARLESDLDVEPLPAELAGIEADRQLKFRAMWNLRRERFQSAIPLLQQLMKSHDIRVVHDASRSLVESYLATGDVEKAAEVYVDALLSNMNLLSAFDSVALGHACCEILSSSRSIALPIAFSIYSRFIGDTFNAALKYSFECFLKNNGLLNPFDMSKSTAFSSKHQHYFLRHVCTPEVMKLYLYFDTSKEIEKCRLEICRFLLGEYEGDEELIFEVKERTRRLVLQEAANQVHSSRIFSDANLLRGPSSSAFRALYERFIALRSHDFSSSKDEEAFHDFLKILQRDPLLLKNAHTLHIQDLVLNEKNSVFLKLIKLVRDEFTFGEKGLNVYLSTRIRHGHFPNTIRKPLLDNGLLASRVTDTAGYKLNKEWEAVLKPDARSLHILEQALIDFSIKFNELVDEVNDTWLRLFTIDQDISGLSKDGEVQKSLFNYSVTAIESFYLQQELGPDPSYTDFVAVATKWLWDRTEQNLKGVQNQLSDDMRLKAFNMVDELGRSVIQKCGVQALGDFPDALARARNSLVHAFDTVNGWFTRNRGISIGNFELDIAIQIASLAADADVQFDDRTTLVWDGSVLNPLVDVFYILFENCISKSGLHKSIVNIRAYAEQKEASLIVTVENMCQPVQDIERSNSALSRYRITAPRYQAAVDAAQLEGGSGFFKIWRLLEKDMNITHVVQLGYVNHNTFRVELEIPLTECEKVVAHENTSN